MVVVVLLAGVGIEMFGPGLRLRLGWMGLELGVWEAWRSSQQPIRNLGSRDSLRSKLVYHRLFQNRHALHRSSAPAHTSARRSGHGKEVRPLGLTALR